MMREISESEVKTCLSELLEAASQPETEPKPTIAELRAETPEENYQRWLEARGPISESLQELLDWRREGLL